MSDYSIEEGDLQMLYSPGGMDTSEDPPLEINIQASDLPVTEAPPVASTSQDHGPSSPFTAQITLNSFGSSWCKSFRELAKGMEDNIPTTPPHRRHYITREEMDQKVAKVKASLDPAFTQMLTSLFIDKGFRVRQAKKRPATNTNLTPGYFTKSFLAKRQAREVDRPGFNFSSFPKSTTSLPNQYVWQASGSGTSSSRPPPPPTSTVVSGSSDSYRALQEELYGKSTGTLAKSKSPREEESLRMPNRLVSLVEVHSDKTIEVPVVGVWPYAYSFLDPGRPMVQGLIDEMIARHRFSKVVFPLEVDQHEAEGLLDIYVKRNEVPDFDDKLYRPISASIFHLVRNKFGVSAVDVNTYFAKYSQNFEYGQKLYTEKNKRKQEELEVYLTKFKPHSFLAQVPKPVPPPVPRPVVRSLAAETVAARIARNPNPVSIGTQVSPPRSHGRSRSPKDSRRSGKTSIRR